MCPRAVALRDSSTSQINRSLDALLRTSSEACPNRGTPAARILYFYNKKQKILLGAELFYSEQKESEVGGGGDEEDEIGELVA